MPDCPKSIPQTVGILANLSKKDAVLRTKELLRKLAKTKLRVLLEESTAAALTKSNGAVSGLPLLELADASDVILVLGGDGTILHTVRLLGARVKPLLGLNLGRLGFMATATECQVDEVVTALATGDFCTSERSCLQADFIDTQGKPARLVGLNEVSLTRGTISRSIHVEVLADGEPLNRFSGDGVILATPTGSTAYSLSAGGPLVTPDAAVFVVTAVCPHTLTSRSIVLPDHTVCKLRAADEREEILLTVDGGEPTHYKKSTSITVKRAPYTVPLVNLKNVSFFRILQEKLRWMGSNL
jgi:NAD+ kinase